MTTKSVQSKDGTGGLRRETTRTAAVMDAIRQRVAARSLTSGEKLPSIRACAAAMAVSTSTVVEAYERLMAEGVIRSRPGSGYYVAGKVAPLSMSGIGPRLDRAVDPFWVSRLSLETPDTMLKPGCGWLPPAWMPQESLRRALRSVARAPDGALADYGTPLGLPVLRQLLAGRLVEKGIDASPDRIVLTDSGTQALDLVCRFLLEPGDTVLVDDPCYFNFHALLRAHRANVVGVPFTPSGPDVERFASVLAERRPRLYITNSGVHNPTGASLAPATAHRLLKLAEEFDATIVEDDIFADFENSPAPRLAAFDGLRRVVHIGSFSKTLSASARVGYVAAPPEWVEDLVDLKIATSFGAGAFAAEWVARVLRDGSYRRHMEALRVRLARAMTTVVTRLEAMGIVPWIRPSAGMFLWARLPGGVRAVDVAQNALADGVVLAPGNVFSCSGSADDFLRFNVAQCGDPRVFGVLRAAIRAGKGTRVTVDP